MELSRPAPAPSPTEAAAFPIHPRAPASSPPAEPRAAWYGPRGLIAAATGVLIVIAWAAALGLAEREQQADLAAAQRQISNLALALDRHVTSLLRLADRTTSRIRDAAVQGDLARIRSQLEQLSDRYDTQLAFAALIGPEGNIAVSSHPQAAGLKISDRDHFQVHVRADDGRPHIGHRIETRVTKKGAITLSRRINGRDGSFAGVAAAGVDLNALDEFFGGFALGAEGSIALMRGIL